MASKEFLENRVDGARKLVEKYEKKLQRILKAEATNWEVNPYYYDEREKARTIKDIEEAKKRLQEYEEKLAIEIEKANSRNVQVIIDFLENWKIRMRECYKNALPKWLEAREKYVNAERAMCDCPYHDKERYSKLYSEYRKAKAEYNQNWKWFYEYTKLERCENGREFAVDFDKLNKDLDKEAIAKYDDIINRTNKIVGTITDASFLSIGMKGDLNGFIIGEKGKANVNTIGAGGYNIQCYHFRTLIKEYK